MYKKEKRSDCIERASYASFSKTIRNNKTFAIFFVKVNLFLYNLIWFRYFCSFMWLSLFICVNLCNSNTNFIVFVHAILTKKNYIQNCYSKLENKMSITWESFFFNTIIKTLTIKKNREREREDVAIS